MAQEIADSTLLDTWGSGGNIVEPDISKIIEGWQLGEQPPHEYMNWLQNTFGSKLNHILKNGVASWNNETEYLAGSSVQHNGNVWLCKTNNTNSAPTDANANWKRIITVESLTTVFNGYVKNTGDETIDGIKTFSSSPIVPTPTTGTQAANKDYADTKVSKPELVTVTGSATFDGTTQNINLTNIGNITLAIGDVIEVSGTTSNNKLFTVESIVDNNNIVVNYEHRGSIVSIPSKKLINETTNCTIRLYNRAKNAKLGEGQGWVFYESTANRNNLIAYPSLPTRTMAVTCYIADNGKSFQISENGTLWKTIFLSPTVSGIQMYSQNIIPSGVFYRANGLQPVSSSTPWVELR